MTEFYIEIRGNVESEAEKIPTTLLSTYRQDKGTTVIKAFADNGYYFQAIRNVYGDLGEIINLEKLS
jgi:hypothetical protein